MLSEDTSLSRRDFLTKGSLALTSLGLLGTLTSSGQTAPLSNNKKDTSLFDVPLQGSKYELPPLPYAYDALEPVIDQETMRLHHDIHFEGYKKGLNQAAAMLEEARNKNDYSVVSYWEDQLAFNGAGYVLHTVFFQNMGPVGSTAPSANLIKTLSDSFGSLEALQSQFSRAAETVQGSGWAILGYQPFGKKLIILQAEKHQNKTQWAVIPILVLDVWEHAYYLKYQNKRSEYVKNWWSVVDWNNVENRLNAAIKLGMPG